MRGKFIVFYGINNLGKTTQAKLLLSALAHRNIIAQYVKYPRYDLDPTGPLLNAYLREGNPLRFSPREFQLLHVINRTQYEQFLIHLLESGTWVVAEDYMGTGIAWGVGAGVDRAHLEHLNMHLLSEDCAILFEGRRYREALEAGHHHETDDELTERVRQAHDDLARARGWHRINANDDRENVSSEIWKIIDRTFFHE